MNSSHLSFNVMGNYDFQSEDVTWKNEEWLGDDFDPPMEEDIKEDSSKEKKHNNKKNKKTVSHSINNTTKKNLTKEAKKKRAREEESFISVEKRADLLSRNSNNNDNNHTLAHELMKERLETARERESANIYKRFENIDDAHKENRDRHGLKLPVFAWNHPNSRTCFYILCSYNTLWNTMRTSRSLKLINAYEQLRPLDPTHLYFDVEIMRKLNNHRSSEELESGIHVRAMDEIRNQFLEMGYIKDAKQLEFIISESSDETKVSLHFHCIVDGGRFENNYHAGSFARHLIRRFQEKHGTDPAKNPFFFKKPSKDPLTAVDEQGQHYTWEPWCDMAVYTRDRNFRMLYNTKATGDYRPLMPIDIYKLKRDYKWRPKSNQEFQREVFFRSILQRISEEEIKKHGNMFKIFKCLDPVSGVEPWSTNNCLYFRLDQSEKIQQAITSLSNKADNANNLKTRGNDTIITTHIPYWVKLRDSYGMKSIVSSRQTNPLFERLGHAILSYWQTKIDNKTDPKEMEKQKVKFLYYDERKKLAKYATYIRYCLLYNNVHDNNHITFQLSLENGFLFHTCFSSEACCSSDQQASVGNIFGDDYKRVLNPLFQEAAEFLTGQKSKINAFNQHAREIKELLSHFDHLPDAFFDNIDLGSTSTTNENEKEECDNDEY